jgi:BirA family biotin operon repressor/biotin-[acetyl-CoA-carboxylase] ligase
VIGHSIIVLEETGSTNDFLLRMLSAAIPEGLVVFAERQTAGRGQRNNRWESASHKGLWFSILLRPAIPLTQSARLTDWAAHCIAAVISRETLLDPTVKSPNDVYLGDRKVAGVLVETRAGLGADYAAVAGLGININQAAEDFPEALRRRAGSLAMTLGRKLDRYAFAVALLRQLDRDYRELFNDSLGFHGDGPPSSR